MSPILLDPKGGPYDPIESIADSLRRIADRLETPQHLDVDKLRRAIFIVSLAHDWANTFDGVDRTAEIAENYENDHD